MSEPLMEFTSRIEGRNAKVAIYEDRIEWGRSGWHPPGGATAAVLSSGMSLLLPGKRKDTNMILIRHIQGVTTHKAGMRFTVVKVATAADVMEFHVGKAQAEEIKDTITRLMLGGAMGPGSSPSAPAPSPPTQALVADELAKLVQLRDAGALTDEEFAAQKARLLGS
jgi:Short C-terminal domain